MILLELLWITFWIGAFLSFSQKLPASFTTNVLPPKIADNLGKFVSQHRPLFVLSNQPLNLWSATLLPTRFLSIDWENNETKTKLTQPLTAQKAAGKSTKKQLCTLGQEILAKQPHFQASSVLTSGTINNAD